MKILALIELLVIALLLCTHLPAEDDTKNEKELVTDTHHTIVFSDELFCIEKEEKQPQTISLKVKKPKQTKKSVPVQKTSNSVHRVSHNGSQFFTFPSNQTVVLEGKNRTKITILPKSFLYEDTQELVQEDITVELKEFYNKSDFVSNKLTTEHQAGYVTESGGIIYLDARVGKRKCSLVKGNHILVALPGYGINSKYSAMKGYYNEDRILQWKEINEGDFSKLSSINNSITLSNSSEKIQVTIGSSTRLDNEYNNENTDEFNNWLANEFSNIISHEDLSAFKTIKTADGYSFTKEIIYDFKTSLGNAIIASNFPDNEQYKWLLKKALYNTPIGICKKDLVSNREYLGAINITVRWNCNSRCSLDNFMDTFRFSNYNNFVNNYVTITSPSLGWLTASRVLNKLPSNKSLDIAIGANDFAEVLLVFKHKNIVLCGTKNDLGYSFKNIPENEEATIVVTKHVNDKTWYSFKKINTKTSEVVLDSFKEYITKQFHRELKSLNTT